MRQIRTLLVPLSFGCVLALTAASASAQDLFELEVFEYESTPAGQWEVAFHTNGVSRESRAPESVTADHRPIHMSVEVTRGWTNRFETAIFIQTAPFGASGSARFAGGHVRSKLRLGELSAIPLRLAVGAEYTFNRVAFDRELQTLEIRPILDYAQGRLSLVANPTLELVIHGTDNEGLAPVFDVSARAAWRLVERVAVTADYFSAAATTRHLQPEPDAHHFIFGGFDVDVGSGWEFGISAGRCVTNRGEPWLMKSILGYRF
jgi:hypothetical protein